ncbi:MAG: hypothetical protein IPP13_21530 [Kouleothrix sp.]|jgi:hypothetical protein|nr:hypothetical protein [Kouleothrix sp.]
MITTDEFLKMATSAEQPAGVRVVHVPQAQPRIGLFWMLTLATVIGLGGWAVGSGAISVTPHSPAEPTVAAVAVPQAPALTAPTQYIQPVQQVQQPAQVRVVPQANADLRFEATAVPATPTIDPNLTRLVAMINSTPTPPPVAGPPECNSQNATFKSHTTAVDARGVPVGRAEAWSCESQAAADAEADARAQAMIAASVK